MNREYQEVSYRTRHEATKVVPWMDAFSFNRHAKHHWLQRLCLGTLRRLGCFANKTETVTRYLEPSGDTIMKKLQEQQREVFKLLNRDATHIYMGQEDFETLVSQQTSGNHVIRVPGDVHTGRYEVFGVEVIMVPWMRGILVAPPPSRRSK